MRDCRLNHRLEVYAGVLEAECAGLLRVILPSLIPVPHTWAYGGGGGLIGITTSDRTLATTRLATSPLWELVAGLYLLGRDRVPWPYTSWAESARAALTRPECEPLTYFARGPAAFPDALLPGPLAAHGALDGELARVAAADPAAVRDEVHRIGGDEIPPGLRPYARDPAGSMARLADAYAAYWTRAVDGCWSVAHDVLAGELLRRGRALATAGVDGLFAGLTAQMVWRQPRLELIKPHRLEIDARHRGIVLVPLVFAAGIRPISWDADAVYVTYQAAGAAALAGPGRRPGPSPLALLLGAGRAQVLEAVVEPANTRALARRLDLAPSTVSEHLGQLVAAGVVGRLRSGHRVYYHANERGLALLDMFAG